MTKASGVKPGLWESPSYGRAGGDRNVCPTGSYVTDIMAFHGQGSYTNAFNMWCYNPDTHEVTRLWKSPTCGKRDRPKVGNVFLDGLNAIVIGLGAIVAIVPGFQAIGATMVAGGVASLAAQGAGIAASQREVLRPGYGRALYDYKYLAAPAGVYKWEINPKENDGIHGLNMHGLQGSMLGWAGGDGGYRVGPGGPRRSVAPLKAKTGTCPLGKVVVGVEASCGDRVDGMKFLCDVPRHGT
jgi:hypothetical protein